MIKDDEGVKGAKLRLATVVVKMNWICWTMFGVVCSSLK